MKFCFSLLFLCACFLDFSYGQCVRSSALQRTPTYDLQGTAFVEELADGSVQFRLSDDFFTTTGPDVQIYLSNDDKEVDGAMFIVDIAGGDGINHFSGALTIDLPADTDIDEYRYVVFRCILFGVYWGGGTLGVSSCDDGSGGDDGGGDNMDEMCVETLVATTDWVDNITVCPNDDLADLVPFRNTVMIPAGSTYAYIITDTDSVIQEIVLEDSFDFEGSSLETQLVFGVSYLGTLDAVVGQAFNTISATDCFILSGTNIFLTVQKEDCGVPFQCIEVNTATTAWETDLTICPSDGVDDFVPLVNNLFIPTGDNFAYLLTDDQDNLIQLIKTDTFNFEGSGNGTNRVYAINYSGNLTLELGSPISAITSSECIAFSDTELFLNVSKGNCPVSSFSVSGQVASPAGDGIAGVEIMNGQNEVLAITNDQGEYTIASIDGGTNLMIRPRSSSSSALINGVSAVDVVIITRHLLDLAPFTSPYTLLAADVNNDNSVSSVDLVQMRRAILGLSSSFSNNTTWRFVDAAQSATGNEISSSPNEEIAVTINNSNVADINFIGVKIGDVNADADLDLNN